MVVFALMGKTPWSFAQIKAAALKCISHHSTLPSTHSQMKKTKQKTPVLLKCTLDETVKNTNFVKSQPWST